MSVHNPEQLSLFLSQLLETNATLDYWTDFEKVKRNVADIEISLNTLNYLLGRQDLHSAVKSLWNRDNRVFEVLPILIAVRKRDKRRLLQQMVTPSFYMTILRHMMGLWNSWKEQAWRICLEKKLSLIS